MREFAIYKKTFLFRSGKKIETVVVPQKEPVRVMARAEGYAMVRFKGCMPFVVSEKELAPTDQQQGAG
mgnify:CR=1 FL=1